MAAAAGGATSPSPARGPSSGGSTANRGASGPASGPPSRGICTRARKLIVRTDNFHLQIKRL